MSFSKWDDSWTLRLYHFFDGNAGSRKRALRYSFKIFSQFGSTLFWGLLMAFLYFPNLVVIYVFPQSYRILSQILIHIALHLFAGFFTVQFTVLPLKYLVRRKRPFQRFESIENFDFRLNTKTASFPSGHCVFWVLFGVLFYYIFENLSILLFFGFTLPIMALSRVVLGAHYISDVIFGIFFGLVVTLLTLILLPFYYDFYGWVFSLIPT